MISVPGEAVNNVYYITPTEPPNSDCPDEPCQTLGHYFRHIDRYFSSDKVNVTMMFLRGNHILNTTGITIQDLETLKMIGIEPANEGVVHFFNPIAIKNVTTTYFGSLTFKGGPKKYVQFQLDAMFTDREISVTINSTLFNSVSLCYTPRDVLNFNMLVTLSLIHI